MSTLFPGIQVIFINPDDERFDVSDRLSDLGSISESLEDDFTQLTHADLDFELTDDDGAVREFLQIAVPDDRYTVEVWRDDHKRRGATRRGQQLLFIGVLDLPWSLSYDMGERTVSVTVYSLTKLLEKTSAETIRRSFGVIRGSTTATSSTLTLSSVLDEDGRSIQSGDVIRLSDATNVEERTVDYVPQTVPATTVFDLLTTEPWENTFSGAEVEILTPYHRNRTLTVLAIDLVNASVLEVGEFDLESEIADVPFISPMNANGLPHAPYVGTIVQTTGALAQVYVNGLGYFVGTPQLGWFGPTVGGGSNKTSGDWTPYHLTLPANFPEADGLDNGTIAWDHAGDHYYTLGGTTTLTIAKDGVFLANVEAWSGSTAALFLSFDYEPIEDEVWVAVMEGGAPFGSKVRIVTSAGSVSDLSGESAGHLRMCRALGVMIWFSQDYSTVKYYDPATKAVVRTIDTTSAFEDMSPPNTWSLRYFDGLLMMAYIRSGRSRLRIWDLDWVIVADYDFASAHSEQTAEAVYAATGTHHGGNNSATLQQPLLVGAYVIGWTIVNVTDGSSAVITNVTGSVPTQQIVGALAGGSENLWDTGDVFQLYLPAPVFLTRSPQLFGFTDDDLGLHFIIWNGGRTIGDVAIEGAFGLISKRYAGVIPYAALDGMSLATGLKELAILALGYVRADIHTGSISILPRRVTGEPVVLLDTPLSLSERPIWEGYRTSVSVATEDQQGVSVTATIGAAPASRAEIYSQFAGSESVALMLASSYRSILAVLRREREVAALETGEIIRPLDIVSMEDADWLVVDAETDLGDREQTLRLIEVIE